MPNGLLFPLSSSALRYTLGHSDSADSSSPVAVFAVFVVAQYGLAVWMVDSRTRYGPSEDRFLPKRWTKSVLHGRMVEIDGP
jgi:hypothetical protein